MTSKTTLKILIAIEVIAVGLLLKGNAFGKDYDFVYDTDIVFSHQDHPYIRANALPSGPPRVNIDLSLDGGTNWPYRIAHGIKAHYGDNTYHASIRITEAMWTENAVIGVRSLWSSTTNSIVNHHGAKSHEPFAIGGLRVLSPQAGETIYSPSYTPIIWHEAGLTAVEIGISTNGVDFASIVALPSPMATNTYILPLANQPSGPMWLAVKGMDVPDKVDVIQLNCINIQ